MPYVHAVTVKAIDKAPSKANLPEDKRSPWDDSDEIDIDIAKKRPACDDVERPTMVIFRREQG